MLTGIQYLHCPLAQLFNILAIAVTEEGDPLLVCGVDDGRKDLLAIPLVCLFLKVFSH